MTGPLSTVMPRSRALDWTCAAMIFVWGVTLALPGATFSTSAAYGFLEAIASEESWAVILVAIGMLRFSALIINGHWTEGSPVIRAFAACLGAIVWLLFFAGFLELSIRGGIVLAGVGINLVLLGADIFSAARAGADAVRARQVANGSIRGG